MHTPGALLVEGRWLVFRAKTGTADALCFTACGALTGHPAPALSPSASSRRLLQVPLRS